MTHGTLGGYTNGRCRCTLCTAANRDHQRSRNQHRKFTPVELEQRRRCLICHTPLNIHPMKACWRELR